MVGWGIFLIVIGAGSLLLPSLGFQFWVMQLMDDFQPHAGIVAAVLGAALLLVGMTRRSRGTDGVTERRVARPDQADTTKDHAARS